MKFTCNQQELSKTLSTVSKAISTRSTLPILKGVLIEAKSNGTLIVKSSDLEISITKKMIADVEEEGSIVVGFTLFSNIIRKLPNDSILIKTSDEENIIIKSSVSESQVQTLPVDDFPKNIEDNKNETEQFVINTNVFKNMMKKISFAASVDESKGILVGILTEIKKDVLTMVALDGLRMAVANESIKSQKEKKIIISARTMNEINKILLENDEVEDLEMNFGEKKAKFQMGSTEVILRLMEGEFIKYADIIPKESTTEVRIGKKSLFSSIERASLLAKEGRNNLIKISIKNNLMIITSRSDEAKVKEEIIMEKTGEDLEIGFNSRFIIDVLKSVDDEEIIMNFQTSTSPCVVRPIEGNNYEYLILPVRIPMG